MAFALTDITKALSEQTGKTPNIILEIEGISTVFGATGIDRLWRIGDNLTIGQADLTIGGLIASPDGKDYISLKGTTNNLTQQIEIDKASVQSVSRFNVNIIDKNQEVTALLTPGNVVDDPLGQDAVVYLNFKGGSHPDDSIRIFNGQVDSIDSGSGSIRVGIAHPEGKKKQQILQKYTNILDGALSDSATTITVDSSSGLITPVDVLVSYVRIDDELMSFTGITSTTITGVVRGVLGTIAVAHDDNGTIDSFYTLEDDPIDLALKLMLSDGGAAYTSALAPSFNQVDPLTFITNAFLVEDDRLQDVEGITVGDLVTITGASNGANNVTSKAIVNVQKTSLGTAITLGAVTFVTETSSSASFSITSEFNVLPSDAACKMRPKEVDVQRFRDLKAIFSASFPDLLFYIKETLVARDFINEQVLFPSGLYGIPRQARVSVNFTAPSLVDGLAARLDDTAVKNPQTLRLKRSTNFNFYNAVTYIYNPDTITDRFLTGGITLSARSINRITADSKPLTIEAEGLRPSPATTNFIRRQTRRFLDRYQFAAEEVECEVTFDRGFNIEVGDAAIFGSNELQLTDITQGTRAFEPRIMEVVNKSLNISTGKIKVKLLDTRFSQDGRYIQIGPASLINSGATTTVIPLKRSFSTGEFELEQAKWQDYIGEEILVRSSDYVTSGTTILTGFDPTDVTKMLVNPALGFTPGEDYLVDTPNYPTSTDSSVNVLWKALHGSFTPQLIVVSGTSSTIFTVSAGDAARARVGSFVRVHSDDFTIDSTPTPDIDDPVIDDITGVTITLDKGLGFTPAAGHLVDLVGFLDGGVPYRWV